MGITMFVSLFSTRLILDSLGASDFGIFTVVGGTIAMLGFLNSTMANSTQRFMSYAEGEGNLETKRRIFNVSIVLHFLIALVTIIILFAAMHLFFNGIFNIEHERILAAKYVYYSLIVSTFLTIINVPYDAIMNAHENMLYYSIVGIFESILKLGIAFICVQTSKDKLVVYALLMACVPVITLSIMKIYCHRHYDECIIAPRRYWDRILVKQVSHFFGWNFLTAISSLFSAQGLGVVLNHFFGSVLNAAQGIAQQVNGVLSNFSVNMMKALNPVIVKNAGAKNLLTMNRASLVGCKYSTLLTLFFAIPLSLEIDYILKIWLKSIPDWAALFCVMQLIITIITQIAQSAATAIYAQGDIKHYAIWKSLMNVLPLLITWCCFRIGCGPLWLYIPMITIWAIGGDIVIIYYAKKKCGLSVTDYMRKVVFPISGTAIIMLICGFVCTLSLRESFGRLVVTCISTSFGMGISGFIFAINKEEREKMMVALNELFKKTI